MAERAYALYSSWGYTTPVPDSGDGLTDISVDDLVTGCLTSGSIGIGVPVPLGRWDARHHSGRPRRRRPDPSQCREGAQLPHRRARGLSPLRGRGLPPDTNQWLHEGLAEWAAVRAENAIGGIEQNPDRTMDCVGSVCGDTEFDRNGYPGWMLFEYLAERFGDSTVKSVLDTSAATPALSGTQALSAVVQPLARRSGSSSRTTRPPA